jgi:hypothetical protein
MSDVPGTVPVVDTGKERPMIEYVKAAINAVILTRAPCLVSENYLSFARLQIKILNLSFSVQKERAISTL